MKKKLTMYHYQGCSKSRAALEILRAAPGVELEVVEYLDTPPTIEQLDRLLNQLGLAPESFVRKHEDEYSELGLETRAPQSRAEWISLLVAHPILIERPVVTDGNRTVIGRPPEKVRELLD